MILPFLPYTPSTLLWISIMQQSLYLKRRVPWPTTLSKIFLLKVKNKLVVNWKGEGTSLSTVFLFFPEKTSMTTLPTTWLLPGDLGGLPSDMEKTEEDIGNCPLSLTCGSFKKKKKKQPGASLVAQWLTICLPVQGTLVRALVWKDPTCRGATRPVSHNYWACVSGACAPQQDRPWQWKARAPLWRVAPACRN